jgi:hypothetical protein
MGLLFPDDLDEWSAPSGGYQHRRPENTLLYQIIQVMMTVTKYAFLFVVYSIIFFIAVAFAYWV